jgi:formate dehydrogenase subunit gamma
MSSAGATVPRSPEGEPPSDLAGLRSLISPLASLPGALLPVLHAVQDHIGFIPESALPVIAEVLNLSVAEVHGVVTFYHWFRRTAGGRKIVRVCRAEACQAMGGDRVAKHAQDRLGIEWHETTKDGRITLEPVFCLGLCACAPAALVDGKVVGRVDEARLDAIIEGVR